MKHADFRQYVMGISKVGQAVGSRVYPVHLPQAVTYPAITYQQVTGLSERHLQGRSDLRFVRMQVDVWAYDILECEAISIALDNALDGYRGEIGDYEATDSWRSGQQDLYEQDVEVFRVTTDYSIYYRDSSGITPGGAPVYEDTTEGLANTRDRDFFWVVGDSGLLLYQNDKGTAVENGEFPTTQMMANQESRIMNLFSSLHPDFAQSSLRLDFKNQSYVVGVS